MPDRDTIVAGVRRSIADLSTEGLDLIGLSEQRVRELIHEHVDYFQMMIGPNLPAEEDQILTVVLRERRRRRDTTMRPQFPSAQPEAPRTGNGKPAQSAGAKRLPDGETAHGGARAARYAY